MRPDRKEKKEMTQWSLDQRFKKIDHSNPDFIGWSSLPNLDEKYQSFIDKWMKHEMKLARG